MESRDGRADEVRAALLGASEEGRVEAVLALLEAGADVNAVTEDGWTALMEASCGGHTEVLTALLEAGADVGLAMLDGGTALLFASHGGHQEAVIALVDAGANVHAATRRGLTALIAASGGGYLETVAALTKAGAHVDASMRNGWTALMAASQGGHLEAVTALLGAGANVNAITGNGRTALVMAAQGGHLGTVAALVGAGARVDLPGPTASLLDEACQARDDKLLYELLRSPHVALSASLAARVLGVSAGSRNTTLMAQTWAVQARQFGGARSAAAGHMRGVWNDYILVDRRVRLFELERAALHGALRWSRDVGCDVEDVLAAVPLDAAQAEIATVWVKELRQFATQSGSHSAPGMRPLQCSTDMACLDMVLVRYVGRESGHLGAAVVEMAEGGDAVMRCAVHAGGVACAMAVAGRAARLPGAWDAVGNLVRLWEEAAMYSVARAEATAGPE